MESVIKTIFSPSLILVNIFNTMGWICIPSAITSTVNSGEVKAAPITPGSRWCSPLIALKVWVT
ncbi:hypothetical protein ES705_26488 [subsurface metagenome]